METKGNSKEVKDKEKEVLRNNLEIGCKMISKKNILVSIISHKHYLHKIIPQNSSTCTSPRLVRVLGKKLKKYLTPSN